MQNYREMITLLFEVSKLTRSFQKEAVFCEDVTFTEFYILDLIDRKGLLPLSALHQALFVEKSTTTRLIEPLVTRKLIVKEKSTEDARVIILKLTEKGREVYIRVWDCVEEFIRHFEKEIPQEKKEAVFSALKILLNILEKLRI